MSQASLRHSGACAAAVSHLEGFAAEILPRILTQIDRDRLSPTWGCGDRNWWHYKIRDFPSIVLQQAGEAVWHAAELRDDLNEDTSAEMRALSAASCRFWNTRAIRRGAFEEYYPNERGYPPLAFSTLSVARLASAGAVPLVDVEAGLRVAARQLLRRFESQAANQQVAGLAALAWLQQLTSDAVPRQSFDRLSARTLDLQDAEGWYLEYDGPDVGYLSVTIDCLWDAYDATHEQRYLESLDLAIDFAATMVDLCAGSPGMLNSRNTDYVLPYGLLRAALERPAPVATRATRTVATLYGGLGGPDHPLRAVDDRYLAHYIGNSVMRAARLTSADHLSAHSSDRDSKGGIERGTLHLTSAGYVHLRDGSGTAITIAGKKGGVFTGLIRGSASVADFGWSVISGDRLLVSHWWSSDWILDVNGEVVTVCGYLFPHRDVSSTPGRHLVLRLLAISLGPRIIAPLKDRMIFRESSRSVRFTRVVSLRADGVEVVDQIDGMPDGASVVRSPRASKRHVASADSSHPQDFEPRAAVEVHEQITHAKGVFEASTRYCAR
jgi:hypothetical protein